GGELRAPFFAAAGELAQLVLDFDVRHHFAADLAEAALAAGDVDQAFLVDEGDVPRLVPAVLDNFGGQLGLMEVTEHDIGTFDPEHAGLFHFAIGSGFEMGRLGNDPRQWAADAPFQAVFLEIVDAPLGRDVDGSD